ncbi:hypothetical protein ACP70R_030424 [Stipagrostis hirtigluma subsp. patula]
MIFELLLVILASLLHHIAAATTNATGGNTSCTPARCGGLDIRYPFSLSGVQPQYCGYEAFDLRCDAAAGRAYLSRTFRDRLFRVQEISYETSSLVVAVEATFAGDATCRVPDFNVSASLAPFPLTVSAANKNLVFVYNCTLRPPDARALLSPPCANHTMGAYISGQLDGEGSAPPWVPGNCSSVHVPVRPPGVVGGEEAGREYRRLIDDGFVLEWLTLGDCDGCKRRGGECRFVQLSFQCVCPDGRLCPNSRVLTAAAASLLFPCICVLIRKRKVKKIWFFLGKKTRSTKDRNIEALIVSYGSLAPKRYKYSEVMNITCSLSNKIGEGGYGMVFKGRLYDGRLVAVKFLHEFKGNGEEFVNEVMSIGRTSHVNIVSLFGFCLERSKRALIYEYMPNGSLDQYIYSENPKELIGWQKLYTIAIGIARGLEYLHHSCNTRIVHFDIKPQNILLDHDFCPKIADFGLAKLCHSKESKLSMTGARGTIGFIAPEVHSRTFGIVSTKSDVYSYGMMLLEMVGGRKNVKSAVQKSSEKYFPDWIYDHFPQDDGLQSCHVTDEVEEIARKMILIGLWCIQVLPMHRPTITKVLEMFERELDKLEMPPKQNFSQILEDSVCNLNGESTNPSSSTNTQGSSEVLKIEEINLVN